ncbi:MAG: histidine--tRNA ligase [Pseudomonadota bacterium]
MSVKRPQARTPRGFQDRLGPAIAAEAELIHRASSAYERWGFQRLDTSAFEFTEALGKFLPDKDRPNEGVFSLQDDDEQWMSLRYDLTAPLARYVAENSQGLPRPFRRWQAGPVWRNEKPGPGRFRQFTQCDADSVGVPGAAADAEIVMLACDALEAVGVQRGEYSLKINTRGALNAVLAQVSSSGAESEAERNGTILRAIDKLDRLGLDGVAALLGEGRMDESGDFTTGAKLDVSSIDRVIAFVSASQNDNDKTVSALETAIGQSEAGLAALDEIKTMTSIMERCGFGGDRAAIDPSVVRGLDYYTGPVFEAELNMTTPTGEPLGIGSVGGGGRYDDLVARFTGEKVPATGFSIGVSRLITALEAAGRPLLGDATGPVLILAFDQASMGDYFELAQRLRKAGIATEVYLGGSGVKAQMKYADRRNSPVAIMFGSDEKEKGIVSIKDLRLGKKKAQAIKDNETWREERPGQFEAPLDKLESIVAETIAAEI